MFSNTLAPKKPVTTTEPKDPSPTSATTKFIYLDMGVYNMAYCQSGTLKKEEWELLLQTINISYKYKAILTDPKNVLHFFQQKTRFRFCDNFECALFYLDALKNGLIVKVEMPSSKTISLENLNWIYILSNLLDSPKESKPDEDIQECEETKDPTIFTFINNPHFHSPSNFVKLIK